MPKPVASQVIVITGGSSGIGLATAIEAARRGARVVLAARNRQSLDEAVGSIRAQGGEAIGVPTDVTDAAQVQALAVAAEETFGRIDTWVNNAGVLNVAGFLDQPLEDFEQVIRVNFLGQVYGARAALPYLEASAGALVCIGSAYGDRGAPLWTAYCASKHAIKGWLDGLRVELRKAGSPVRVTLIKPATINTPLFGKAKTQIGVKPVGMPPYYAPELVAEAVLHAAESDERDVYVGESGLALSLGERMSPKLVDAFMGLFAFPLQRSHEPKDADAPNNLYAPVTDDGGVRDGLPELRWSPYAAAKRHPMRALAAAGLVAGLAAAVTRRRR
mgnify:CR=1 FL=1|jgi:NAD(P)-dependent dehydrogenase (short-subunit alcohol dehydrogenase family)